MSAEPSLDWRGDDVTIADVLAALNRVRKAFARQSAGDADHPHPRNSVMTLVAVVRDAAEEQRALDVVTTIATQHPSLAIVVRDQPRVRAGRIDASVASHPVLEQSGVAAPCEIVTLHVHGAAGSHLSALVDPLLVSGVPTYFWWLGTPPFGASELTDALRICDALVVDSAGFNRPHDSFLGLADMALRSHPHLGLGDFQWERLTPWRETTAQFFAPADRRQLMKGVSEIGIDYVGEARGNRIGAALLVGWFASAIGWKLERAAAGGGGVVAAIFKAEGWRPVQVAFRSVPKERLSLGEVSALRVAGTSAGKSFRVVIQRDPERLRQASEAAFRVLHPTGGEDEAGMEIAHRRASQHLGVVEQNRDALHHTATGDAPGESVPSRPKVIAGERRRQDTSDVLLTMIDIGQAATLRHVQRVPPDNPAAILMRVLMMGARNPVYNRSLAAAAVLMRAI